MSQIPQDSTSEQTGSYAASVPQRHDANDIARRRLEAARLAMRPPKRPIFVVAAWVTPLVAVALIAVLAVALLSAQHAGRPAAIVPTACRTLPA